MAKTLTEIALDEALADRAALDAAAKLADEAGEPLVVSLVRFGGIGEVALVAAIRRHLRVGVADPASVAFDTDALREVPRELCQRRRVLPLTVVVHGAGPRTLLLAMADPTDQVAIAEVEHVTGCRVEPTLMTLSAVEELIDTGYRGFVTQVMKREPKPRRSPKRSPIPAPSTTPHHRVSDEAAIELRHRALVRLLVDRGVVSLEDYDEAVRDLLKGRDDDA